MSKDKKTSFEQLTLMLMKKHGVSIDSGARYSIRCQYGQIENIVRDVLEGVSGAFHDSHIDNYVKSAAGCDKKV